MGCAQSRIEQEESVARCKERRQLMKAAVAHRNAFAAAHSAYSMSLKSVGAALNDYGLGEVLEIRPVVNAAPPEQLPPSPPPPPPHPDDFAAASASIQPPPPPPPPPPLQKAMSMPDLRRSKQPLHPDESIREEEEVDGAETVEVSVGRSAAPSTPPTGQSSPWPDQSGHWQDYIFSYPDSIPEMLVGDPTPSTPLERKAPPLPENGQESEYRPRSEDHTSKAEKLPSEEVEEVPPPPSAPLPPKAATKQKQSTQLAVGGAELKRARGGNVNLIQILHDLDDQFLKASESGQAVTKMLEAHRLHYHSNFADNRGHIDHSAQVMRVITWNRSFKGIHHPDEKKDANDPEETETHATILDQLLAWEKKLYDEVKAGETMKVEYQRKMALLNKQKKNGVSTEALEKTKAAVSHLHTRYIVDMQSMDSTVSEIYRLRDELLYPRLVELVNGMAVMWETMYSCHDHQKTIVNDLRLLDVSSACKETVESHHERTVQLCRVTSDWSLEFQKLVQQQKEYIQTLNNWVRLSAIPIESSLREKVSSPPRVVDPAIQNILRNWNDELEHLPDEVTKNAVTSFSAIVEVIRSQQQDELNQRRKCEDAKRDYDKKLRSFVDWREKYMQKKRAEGIDHSNAESADEKDTALEEREYQVNMSKNRWQEELDSYTKLCKQTREKSLGSLKTGLPALLNTMFEFSFSCSESYKKLMHLIRAPRQTEKAA